MGLNNELKLEREGCMDFGGGPYQKTFGLIPAKEKFLQNARKGNLKGVRKFLSKKWGTPSPSLEDAALLLASWYGHISIVRELLKRKVATNTYGNNTGHTALHFAISENHPQIAIEIIMQNHTNLGCHYYASETPIILAAKLNMREVIFALLKHHNRINLSTPDGWGCKVLHYAAYNGDISVVNAFLNSLYLQQIYINHTSHSGKTALAHALTAPTLTYEHWRIVKALLKAGIDPEKGSHRNKPLAVLTSRPDINDSIPKLIFSEIEKAISPDKKPAADEFNLWKNMGNEPNNWEATSSQPTGAAKTTIPIDVERKTSTSKLNLFSKRKKQEPVEKDGRNRLNKSYSEEEQPLLSCQY